MSTEQLIQKAATMLVDKGQFEHHLKFDYSKHPKVNTQADIDLTCPLIDTSEPKDRRTCSATLAHASPGVEQFIKETLDANPATATTAKSEKEVKQDIESAREKLYFLKQPPSAWYLLYFDPSQNAWMACSNDLEEIKITENVRDNSDSTQAMFEQGSKRFAIDAVSNMRDALTSEGKALLVNQGMLTFTEVTPNNLINAANYVYDARISTPAAAENILESDNYADDGKRKTPRLKSNLNGSIPLPPLPVSKTLYQVTQTQKENSCMLNSATVGAYLVQNPTAIAAIEKAADKKNNLQAKQIQILINESDTAFLQLLASSPNKSEMSLGLQFNEAEKALNGDLFKNSALKDTEFLLEESTYETLEDHKAYIQGTLRSELAQDGALIQVTSIARTHTTIFGHSGGKFWEFDALRGELNVFNALEDAVNALINIYNGDLASKAHTNDNSKITKFASVSQRPKVTPTPQPPAPSKKVEEVTRQTKIQDMLKVYQETEDAKLLAEEKKRFKHDETDTTQARTWLKEEIIREINEVETAKNKKTSQTVKDLQAIRVGLETGAIHGPAPASTAPAPDAALQTSMKDSAARAKTKEVRFAAKVSHDPTRFGTLSFEAKLAVLAAETEKKPLVVFTLKTDIDTVAKPNKPKELIKIDDPTGAVFKDNADLLNKLNGLSPKIAFDLKGEKYSVVGELLYKGTADEYVAFKKIDSKNVETYISEQDILDYANANKASLTEQIMNECSKKLAASAHVVCQSVETATFTKKYRP